MINLRYHILWLIMLVGLSVTAQLPNFIKAYTDLDGHQTGFSIVADDLGYTVSSLTTYQGYKYDYITHVDLEGNLVWKKHYGRQYFKQSTNHQNSIIRVDDGYVLYGHYWPRLKTDTTTGPLEHEYYLFKIDLNGDSLWFKEFNPDPESFKIAKEIILDPRDGGFYLIGDHHRPNDLTAVHLMKTDSLGNLLWEQDLYINHLFKLIVSSDLNDEGELLIFCKTDDTFQGDDYIEYFIVSPDGDLLVHKELGVWEGFTHPVLFPLGYWLPDGTIIRLENGDTIKVIPDSLPMREPISYIKMDREGNSIDSVFRWGGSAPLVDGIREFTQMIWAEDLDNGDIVTMGSGEPAYIEGGGGAALGLDIPWAMRISPDLTTKWDRHYYIKDRRDCTGSFDFVLVHATSTSDNGIAFTGDISDSIWVDDELYCVSNVIVIKVDSMGCVTPGCDEPIVVVAVEEAADGRLSFKQIYFDLYPNPIPSGNQMRIDFPQGVQYSKAYIRVSDMMGREVHRETISIGREQLAIETDGWISGVYLVSYFDDRGRMLQTERVVVE